MNANVAGGFLCLDRSFGQGTRTTSCPSYPELCASVLEGGRDFWRDGLLPVRKRSSQSADGREPVPPRK